MLRDLATVVTALALTASAAWADEGRRPVDDDWPVQSTGPLAVDAGLVLALPATWQTGLSSGIGAGVTRGRRFAWGVRGSWSSATESSLVWTVSHDDVRLRGVAAIQQPFTATGTRARLPDLAISSMARLGRSIARIQSKRAKSAATTCRATWGGTT
jgi:hypothetical protein